MKDIVNEALNSDNGDNLYFAVAYDISHGMAINEAIKKNCNNLRESGQEFIADTYEILMEADVQFLNAQVFVLSHLSDHPTVNLWGREHVDGWKFMSSSEKLNKMFEYLGQDKVSGGLAVARNYMELTKNADVVIPHFVYDVHDVEEPYTGVKAIHWEQFKKSKVYDDLEKIFLKAF